MGLDLHSALYAHSQQGHALLAELEDFEHTARSGLVEAMFAETLCDTSTVQVHHAEAATVPGCGQCTTSSLAYRQGQS